MRTLERLEVAQVATAGTEPRAPVLEWDDRLDLLLHALAQLPDAVTLEVHAPLPELRLMRLIAGQNLFCFTKSRGNAAWERE